MKAQNTYLEFNPPVITDEKMEWLVRRQSGIGGSDAGTCLGVNKYKGLYELFIDKTTQPVDEQTEPMYWGTTLERIIITEFIYRFGIDWDKVSLGDEISSERHPWQRANLDAMVKDDPHEGTFIVEAKNASFHVMDDWGDSFIPEHIYAQCQHNMMVSGTSKCYVPVLFQGNNFNIYRVIQDDDYCEKLYLAEQHFWNEHVLMKKCPPADDTSRDELLRQHPVATAEETVPNSKVDLIVEQIDHFDDAEKAAKKEKESLRNQLAQIIGDGEQINGITREAKWSNSAGRETIDKAALEKEYPGIIAKFKKIGKPYRTLRLK